MATADLVRLVAADELGYVRALQTTTDNLSTLQVHSIALASKRQLPKASSAFW